MKRLGAINIDKKFTDFINDKKNTATLLNEVQLKTALVGGFLLKSKEYAKKLDGKVKVLKSDAIKIKSANTIHETNKVLGDALTTIADLFFMQRKIQIYNSLTSASTGVGVDESSKLIKKISKITTATKPTRRRRR